MSNETNAGEKKSYLYKGRTARPAAMLAVKFAAALGAPTASFFQYGAFFLAIFAMAGLAPRARTLVPPCIRQRTFIGMFRSRIPKRTKRPPHKSTRKLTPKPTLRLTPHCHYGTPRGVTRRLKKRHNTANGFTKGMRAPMSMSVLSLCMYREDKLLAESV